MPLPKDRASIQPNKDQVRSLALDYLTLDPRLQSRKLNPAVVKDYARLMRNGNPFPAILVVRDRRDTYYLVDGYHRVAATREVNGIDVIDTEIVEGTFTYALWLSWGANRAHGLRRTQKEKRAAIRAALQHPNWCKQSDRAIGRHIGCDHKTVGAIRSYLKRQKQVGEFPKGPSGLSSGKGPSKTAILRACRLLAGVQPERARQFEAAELAIVRSGHDALYRLLHDPKSHPGV